MGREFKQVLGLCTSAAEREKLGVPGEYSLGSMVESGVEMTKKAGKARLYSLEAMLGAQVEELKSLAKCLQDVFVAIPPPKRNREIQFADSRIGVCKYRLPGTDTFEEFEVACGISDVATSWSRYPRVTGSVYNELGKLLSRHYSAANNTCLHANDWGISAKPPEIYGARFQESLCLYFGVPRKRVADAVRCGVLPCKPSAYYLPKPCPRCTTPVDKSAATRQTAEDPFVTCLPDLGGCGFRFCWTCSAPYDQGLVHEQSCVHFEPLVSTLEQNEMC